MLNALAEISPTIYAIFTIAFILLNIGLYREIKKYVEITK